MEHKIKKLSDLEKEKARLKILGDAQVKEMKKSYHQVKNESKNVLLRKVLIPAGVFLLAGYGLKKLLDVLQSDDTEYSSGDSSEDFEENPQDYQQQIKKQNNGLFSNVDWASLVVKATPFIISIGKKMYEDGNLPFLNPPHESVGDDV